MSKITEDFVKLYAREAAIDTTIKIELKHNVSIDQIVQDLVEEYDLDAEDAMQRIEEFKNETQTA
jgi:hypothetical protein